MNRKDKSGFVYIFYLGRDNLYKIGRTTNLEVRLKSLRAGNTKLSCVYSIYTNDCVHLEKRLHKHMEPFLVEREIFVLTDKELKKIFQICDDTVSKEQRVYGQINPDKEYPVYKPPQCKKVTWGQINKAWKVYKKLHKHDRLNGLSVEQFYKNLRDEFLRNRLYEPYL